MIQIRGVCKLTHGSQPVATTAARYSFVLVQSLRYKLKVYDHIFKVSQHRSMLHLSSAYSIMVNTIHVVIPFKDISIAKANLD